MGKTTVIAVSGASGCGKTSLVKALAAHYDCPYIMFDDYVDQSTYPKDMKKWYEDGANSSEITTPHMHSILSRLICTESQYIFVEEPFGRARDSLGSYIDYVILLDLPLELCLTRVIERNRTESTSLNTDAVEKYVEKYHDHLKNIYQNQVARIRSECDYIINRERSVLAHTENIVNWLNELT